MTLTYIFQVIPDLGHSQAGARNNMYIKLILITQVHLTMDQIPFKMFFNVKLQFIILWHVLFMTLVKIMSYVNGLVSN